MSQIRLHPTSVPHPNLSNNQNLCPFGKYRRPGLGEGARGEEKADEGDWGMAGMGEAEQGGGSGMAEGQYIARRGRQGGRRRRIR